ncbi:LysR substrate-binding domain-containing protein [Tomitella gaofuii]|uniref:LysR substrate-binding domain-containing protein n=1 Tax=Tomitella gaofuii TaxID=2760083 RepID=UPI0015FBDBC6|nr:LysR substrate-binding domain-containing protein [Tomitella gaofuii]
MPDSPTPPDAGEAAAPRFRLAFTPGATPGKWARVWEQRLPDVPLELIPAASADGLAAVRADDADAALVRLPIDREGLHAIPLYTEVTVVMMPKDHVLTLAESLTPEDLDDEIVHHPLDDVLDWNAPPGTPSYQRPATIPDALALVAAGVGLVALPQSLARLHHRKDLVYRPLEEPDSATRKRVAQSQVALVWREDRSTELMDEFIGIVRGRTANSSRGTGGPARRSGGPARKGSGGSAGAGGTKGAKGNAGGKGSAGGRRTSGPRRGRPAGRPKRRRR